MIKRGPSHNSTLICLLNLQYEGYVAVEDLLILEFLYFLHFIFLYS